MKKIICIILLLSLSLSLVFGLTACGDKDETPVTIKKTEETPLKLKRYPLLLRTPTPR